MNFSEKASVISSLWLEFKEDEDFSDFMEYNNVGCPLAYASTQGLIAQLTPQGIEIVEETFNQFIDEINVSEEEIDEVLPDKNLGAILLFSYNKNKAAAENASLVDSDEDDQAPIPLEFDTSNPNRGDLFSHYGHAFNALFGTQFFEVKQIAQYSKEHGQELMKKAGAGDPEAMLTVAMIYCTEGDNYSKAHSLAKSALTKAESLGLSLGRFYFGYGFALEQIEDFDSAVDAHEEALDLGFGAAAFNFGRIMMVNNLDLGTAIRVWKIGRDHYKDYVCKEMIEDLETSPGVYQATVQGADGSAEILIASDNPGGLGTFRQ